MKVLFTGVTGELGFQLAKVLLHSPIDRYEQFFFLVRDSNCLSRDSRFKKIFSTASIRNKIRFVVGDISLRHFGLPKPQYNALVKKISTVYHCAALTNFYDSIKNVRYVNVEGSRNVIRFLDCIQGYKELHYLSTIFVAGNRLKGFSENDLDVSQKFRNPYEQSKFEAELLIRQFSRRNHLCKISIYRPSIVVGSFLDGKTHSFQMFYQTLRMLMKGFLCELPVDKKSVLDLVPVDLAASMISALSFRRDGRLATYHVISSRGFNSRRLILFASKYFDFKIPKFTSYEKFSQENISSAYRKLLDPFVAYLNQDGLASSQVTRECLRQMNFKFPKIDDSFLYRLFRYSRKVGYVK